MTASRRILLGLGKIKRERDSGPFRGRKELCEVAIRCSSHQADVVPLFGDGASGGSSKPPEATLSARPCAGPGPCRGHRLE